MADWVLEIGNGRASYPRAAHSSVRNKVTIIKGAEEEERERVSAMINIYYVPGTFLSAL